MVNRMLCFAGLLALSSVARAGTCEDDFEALGDARNGLVFMGSIQKPGMSVSSALGQLQEIARGKSYQIGNESITDASGELVFTQTNVSPPIVMRAQADSTGQVSLGTKLGRGQQVDVENARKEICLMLNMLKPGKEGEAIAASARARHDAGQQVIDAEAPKLSAEIGGDIQKTMAGVNNQGQLKKLLIGSYDKIATQGERNQAFAPIVAKYQGRKYRIDGQVYTVSTQYNGDMQVAYLVTQTKGLFKVRQRSDYNNLNFGITCTLAPDQAKFFLTLSGGDWVKLSGTVSDITPNGMELRDCRQAN
jgi:hypothetical protein